VSLRPHLAAFNPDTPRRLSTPLLTPFNSTPTSSLVRTLDPNKAEKAREEREAQARAKEERDAEKAKAKEEREREAREKRDAEARAAMEEQARRDEEAAAAREAREREARDLAAASARRVLLTLVPIRPRSRGERRSLRTFPGASLRPSLAFNPRPRSLSTPTDAFQLHPDIIACMERP